MIVTAWNNSSYHKSGAGYGLSFSKKDRDKYLKRNWGQLVLVLENYQEITVNIDKPSFWDKCPHVISKEIGLWLLRLGLGSWPERNPPRFDVTVIRENCFKVMRQS